LLAGRGGYTRLVERTGIAKGALEVIGKRLGYNATIGTLEKICIALDVIPGDLLELIDDPPKSRRPSRRKRR
jgi:DNA-binding Xre family transcriptional regulator